MDRSQYFALGVLSFVALSLSALVIVEGLIDYGMDAVVLIFIAWIFERSVYGIIDSVRGLRKPKPFKTKIIRRDGSASIVRRAGRRETKQTGKQHG